MPGKYVTVGDGALFKETEKSSANSPDYTGRVALAEDQIVKIMAAGGKCRIAGWLRKDNDENPYISLSVSLKQEEG